MVLAYSSRLFLSVKLAAVVVSKVEICLTSISLLQVFMISRCTGIRLDWKLGIINFQVFKSALECVLESFSYSIFFCKLQFSNVTLTNLDIKLFH